MSSHLETIGALYLLAQRETHTIVLTKFRRTEAIYSVPWHQTFDLFSNFTYSPSAFATERLGFRLSACSGSALLGFNGALYWGNQTDSLYHLCQSHRAQSQPIRRAGLDQSLDPIQKTYLHNLCPRGC